MESFSVLVQSAEQPGCYGCSQLWTGAMFML